MNGKSLYRCLAGIARIIALSAMAILAAFTLAQTGAVRYVGTITAINGDTLTVKTDAGELRQVEVAATATLRRVEPGQKDLSGAAAIQLADLETGDRVLVRLDPSATGAVPQAAQVVTIKAADVAQKQLQDREEWQRSGVGGLVKSVDPNAGLIVLASGAGPTLKVVSVRVSKSTVLKRYAPTSVRYDLAQTAPISEVQPGDQLRARGSKNADGTEIDALEVVSGSFRNISGTISSLDTSNSSFTVKDLLTKKQVTVHVTPNAQMRALPEPMARMLAARLKGTTPAGAGGAPGSAAGQRGGAAMMQPPGGTPTPGGLGGPGNGQRASGGPGGGAGWIRGGGPGQSGDMQQVLNRAPAIQFSDLKKSEAVMLVSTSGSSDVTAITLLTGVEPLLEAPEASRNLLANWSMGSGGGGEAETP